MKERTEKRREFLGLKPICTGWGFVDTRESPSLTSQEVLKLAQKKRRSDALNIRGKCRKDSETAYKDAQLVKRHGSSGFVMNSMRWTCA